MHPVLWPFDVFGRHVEIHTYGVLVALGFFLGLRLAHREGKRLGLDGGRVLDLAFWMVIAGIAGSRLLYVLLNADDFVRLCRGAADDGRAAFPHQGGPTLAGCTAALRVWEGGLVFYGGVAAALIVAVRFARRENWRLGDVADTFAPSLAIGHALGRVGCFFAGCCYGKVCAPAFGVIFPPHSAAAAALAAGGDLGLGAATPPLLPVQLYEALAEALLFVGLVAWRRRKRFAGEVALLYAICYALLRFGLEMLRGDEGRRFVVEITTPSLSMALGLPPGAPTLLSIGQVGSLVLAVTCTGLWLRQRSRPAQPARPLESGRGL